MASPWVLGTKNAYPMDVRHLYDAIRAGADSATAAGGATSSRGGMSVGPSPAEMSADRREDPNQPVSPDFGGGTGTSMGEATAGTPTVASAAQAANQGGMVPGMPTVSNANSVGNLGNLAIALLGGNPAIPTVPSPAMALFGLTNSVGGRLSGLNTDPVTGLPVQVAMARSSNPDESAAMEALGFDPNAPATSPLTALGQTIGASFGNPNASVSPFGANEAGFSTSPFSTGTPFSANPAPLGRGMDSAPPPSDDGTGAPPGSPTGQPGQDDGGMGGVPSGAAPSGNDASGPAAGSAPGPGEGSAYKRGGVIPDKHKGKGDDEPIRAQGGEAVMAKKAVQKFAPQLSAMNVQGGGRPIVPPQMSMPTRRGAMGVR